MLVSRILHAVFEANPFLRLFGFVYVCYKSSLPCEVCILESSKYTTFSSFIRIFRYVCRMIENLHAYAHAWHSTHTHTRARSHKPANIPKARANESRLNKSSKWLMFHGWKAVNCGANTNTRNNNTANPNSNTYSIVVHHREFFFTLYSSI